LLAGKFCRGQPADRGFETPRHLHRADLHAILLAGVTARDPDAVLTNKRLTDVRQTGATVSAHFADGTAAEADILIGADGSRSAVRRTLWDSSVPEFAGQLAFRCLVPYQDAAHLMAAGNAVVYIGAGRIFNRYLIRGGDLINIIGIVRNASWQHEGWKTPASVDEFREEFAGFHPEIHALIAHAPPETLIKWGLFVRPPLAQWSAGRVILIGDAAHPILPFLGLGATLAIEDGVILPRTLATHADVPSAYAAFQDCRRERVETVRTRTIEQGEIIQASDPDALTLTRSPSQNVNLFDYDPGAVPVYA
jgi:salicylate hydroxylase